MKPEIEKKITELLEFAKENGLAEISWREKDFKISFRREPFIIEKLDGSAESNGVLPSAEPVEFVKSPIVGTFRRSTTKNRPPLVMKGNKIKPGDRLGVVECMKIPTDVFSYVEGEIREILVEDGQPVEYGQSLFSILVTSRGSTNGRKVI